MKIANIIRSVMFFVLLAPLAVQSENFEQSEHGSFKGKPFQVLQQQIDALQQLVADLQAQLAAFSLNDNGDIVISGVNVYIQDGLGTTECGSDSPYPVHDCNGKGNLIVGYDLDNGDLKTGNHNLVIGDGHTYTSYGGFVAGRNNEISNSWASVTGGATNVASGSRASISGGRDNVASGTFSSVGGGDFNIASGIKSSVSGGRFNTAIGENSSVSGGGSNIAVSEQSTVGGGLYLISDAAIFGDWVASSPGP